MTAKGRGMHFLIACLLTLLALPASAVERVIHYHNDALGSPIAATDGQGRVVWCKSYGPYGQPIGSGAPNEPGYTGKLEEPGLGIQDFGARWYDPRIGRFLTVDPVGFDPQNPQSFNRYAYANNNPYKYVDPDGRWAETALDVISLGLSLNTFNNDPSLANGLGLAYDGIATAVPFLPAAYGIIKGTGKAADALGDAGKGATEVVQRAMSKAELRSIQESGTLSRGGRPGDHFVSDAVNSSANRARQRLALPGSPEVRATLEVPSGVFSSRSKVAPKYNMPGEGMERTAPGNVDVPARVLDVSEY